jgi:hypothetical protein
MTRAEIVAEARSWIGTRFRPKGRSRQGVDCIGLLVVVGRAFAVPHEDQQHYTDWPDPERRMLATFDRYLLRCLPGEPDWDGTLGVFPTHKALPGHVGFFSSRHGQRHLVHARASAHVVLEEPFDTDPQTRSMLLVARYAFPGLAV